MPTIQERNTIYRDASPEIQYLYHSPESGEIMLTVFEKNKLSKNTYKTYANIIGDIILGFFEKNKLQSLLISEMNIDENSAKTITHDLEVFLTPIKETTIGTPENEKNESKEELKIETKEPQKTGVQPVHTMEDDAHTVTGYENYQVQPNSADIPEHSSTQEEILTGKKPLTDLPSYRD